MRHALVLLLPVLACTILPVAAARGQAHESGAADSASRPEALQVAIIINELSGVVSGSREWDYVIDGVSGRWRLTTVTADRGRPDRSAAAAASGEPRSGLGSVLRTLADVNLSGDVSLAEASRLPGLLQFGYIRNAFRELDASDHGDLVTATGLSEAQVAEQEAELRDLRRRAGELGMALPWGEDAE